MSILVNKASKVLVQGFTGTEGTFHAAQMIEYGTQVVGGVTPGKGGTDHLDRRVFNTVADCVKETGANVSIIFVPPSFAPVNVKLSRKNVKLTHLQLSMCSFVSVGALFWRTLTIWGWGGFGNRRP